MIPAINATAPVKARNPQLASGTAINNSPPLSAPNPTPHCQFPPFGRHPRPMNATPRAIPTNQPPLRAEPEYAESGVSL